MRVVVAVAEVVPLALVEVVLVPLESLLELIQTYPRQTQVLEAVEEPQLPQPMVVMVQMVL
jgi:hypothetical protein